MKKIRYSKELKISKECLEIDVTHSELNEEYTVKWTKEYREYGEKTFVEDGNALVRPTSKSLEQVENLGEKMALLVKEIDEVVFEQEDVIEDA